ncbi:uncharacterized protein LOC124140565 isoform X1 [Haliotis rufescens]|uniref:uncharacterized protein LOC124140565 isoform X1 n=1 Tax=Haliotis rufescens TaxID=6454 RepID=UPI001EB01B54|nr:uncharacterized protein LOC124140565 isoform X1 [Haliotis rufescens]
MSSKTYDPRKFEFVARMGRIVVPNQNSKTQEPIPVTFRIPEPPQQELVQDVLLGRNMRAAPFGKPIDVSINLDDFIQDLPRHRCSLEDNVHDDGSTRKTMLKEMMESRARIQKKREAQMHAQQLVNEALLQSELRASRKREDMLQNIMTKLDEGENRSGANLNNAEIFEEGTPPELKEYIQEELQRLVPIFKEGET